MRSDAMAGGFLAVAGYASLFGTRDLRGDLVLPGAFARRLSGTRVRMLWRHDPRAVIGIWDAVHEDARGLHVRGRISTGTTRGREIADLMLREGHAGLSIGFRTIRAAPDGTGRILQEVALEEVSIVPDPMLPGARATAVAAAPTHQSFTHRQEVIMSAHIETTFFTREHPQFPTGAGLEIKAMHGLTGADGGFLATPTWEAGVRAVLTSNTSLRSIANVEEVEGGALDIVIDSAMWGGDWATETGNRSETATGTIRKVSIGLHELHAMPKVTQRLIDDVARERYDLDTFVAERVSAKFARLEAAAFVSGDGIGKPRGFMDYPMVANASWTWGSIGFMASGDATAIPGDAPLIDLIQALPQAYREHATWVMNSRTAGQLRKTMAAQWRGEAELLGYPVLLLEDMPDITANACPVAFGDFRRGYTVIERPGIQVLRDPYSAKPHVLFQATRRVGGGLTDFAAIRLLKVST